MSRELILTPEKNRLTTLPLKYPHIWKAYKDATACMWTVEEVDLSKDTNDWELMSEDERFFIKHVLAFFAASDTIVNINLLERFSREVQPLEAKNFYGFQVFMEQIHSEMYSLMIETYVKDPSEKDQLFRAVETVPAVKKKADWAFQWINNHDAEFAVRLVAFAAVEGIFFSGSFCSIYWLKSRNLMPGLTKSNEFISRDEGMHTDFAVLLYQMIQNKPSQEIIHTLIKEAVECEKEFITESLPCQLIGMNADLMKQYIEFVADRLVTQLGYAKIYKVINPFDFMELISLEKKQNFFETRPTEYSKAGVGQDKSAMEFRLDEDF